MLDDWYYLSMMMILQMPLLLHQLVIFEIHLQSLLLDLYVQAILYIFFHVIQLILFLFQLDEPKH